MQKLDKEQAEQIKRLILEANIAWENYVSNLIKNEYDSIFNSPDGIDGVERTKHNFLHDRFLKQNKGE